MILDDITEHKRREVARDRGKTPFSDLVLAVKDAPAARDFTAALRRPDGAPVRIIAEVKKASPSKGVIREDFHPVEIAQVYEANGASAISVLTDERFFRGALPYMTEVKASVGLPVMRKDFIIDEYQIYQSRAAGADALLLIAAILTGDEIKRFLDTAAGLGLYCLVEVHDEAELDAAVEAGARLIGVNNRDLKTFRVDISTTVRLAPLAPAGAILVSESGVQSREDVRFLGQNGVHAVLIGESLMRSPDIGAKLREFTGG